MSLGEVRRDHCLVTFVLPLRWHTFTDYTVIDLCCLTKGEKRKLCFKLAWWHIEATREKKSWGAVFRLFEMKVELLRMKSTCWEKLLSFKSKPEEMNLTVLPNLTEFVLGILFLFCFVFSNITVTVGFGCTFTGWTTKEQRKVYYLNWSDVPFSSHPSNRTSSFSPSQK